MHTGQVVTNTKAMADPKTNDLLDFLHGVERIWRSFLQDQLKPKTHESFCRIEKSIRQNRLDLSLEAFSELKRQHRLEVARSATLLLELINCAETAYRSHRLALKDLSVRPQKVNRVTFVMTAHPTEARSPEFVQLMERVVSYFRECLDRDEKPERKAMNELLSLAWHVPFSKHEKPTVADEAQYIYSIILKPHVLQTLAQPELSGQVYLRTWVGGDKDGHPGVTSAVFVRSLQVSRRKILKSIESYLGQLKDDLNILKASEFFGRSTSSAEDTFQQIKESIGRLRKVEEGDGNRINELDRLIAKLERELKVFFQGPHNAVESIKRIVRLFPVLVVPLEFREESTVINEAIEDQKKHEIVKMLETLNKICGRRPAVEYVRGFVISMTESAKDILNAFELCARQTKNPSLPIIPLFETRAALLQARPIMKKTLQNERYEKALEKHWSHTQEIMLGYSDSAKENGAFYSRRLIQKVMFDLETYFKRQGICPVFFHGSGGSVARGGGAYEDQVAWWPPSAIERFKATIQGEMVSRTFATSHILQSNLKKIFDSSASGGRSEASLIENECVENFLNKVGECYREKVANPEFLKMVERATPYQYLSELKMGSRPSRRKKGQLSLESLRAIPWVLCWTQTRTLFPVWWGIGQTWEKMTANEKAEFTKVAHQSAFLKSFVRLLGFTLAKVRLPVWSLYLNELLNDSDEVQKIEADFASEYKKTCEFVRDLSGQENLLWYRPWLNEVIALRNPYVDMVNLAQISAVKTKDSSLLREATTGVASGMLTTG